MASGNSPQIPLIRISRPQQDPQPPPAPPLDSPRRLSAKIQKVRNRFDDHPTHQSPNATEQSMEEGTTVPRSVQTKAKVDEVLKVILLHKDFSPPNLEIRATDQPKFDDLEAYNVTDEQAKTLWAKEAERLVNVVNNPETELRFSGQDILKGSSKAGYTKLSSMAKRIYGASMIWKHDNELLALLHFKYIHMESNFRKAQGVLYHFEPEANDNTAQTEAPDINYLRAYFALVDYISAVIARLLSQSAHGVMWMNHCLATLAKWATKVKVVSEDLPAFARLSLDTAAAHMPRDIKGDEQGFGPSEKKIGGNAQSSPLASDDGTRGLESDAQKAKVLYFLSQVIPRMNLQEVIEYILQSLVNQRHSTSGRPISSFELCSVVYETGFAEGFKTLLFQDRDGEFMASSDLTCLNLAHSAFAIVGQAVQQSRARSHPPKAPGLQTMIRWSYQEDPDEASTTESSHQPSPQSHLVSPTPNRLILTTMEGIITVMVPLLLTSPYVVSSLKDYIQMASRTSSLTNDDVLLYDEKNFKAFFHMFTSEFEAAALARKDANVSSLSHGLMNRDKLLSGPRIAEIIQAGTTAHDMSTGNCTATNETQTMHTNLAKIREANRTMNEWIFDEKVVIVNCGPYVWSVITVGTILVLGGLGVGFTVRNHLIGVDPFNITTYCWVLAAFFILVCKSLLVQEWPWRDFLLRRVQCRSVSELQAVTGINAQLILAKLLHDESATILNTRGPFNPAFTRKADDGFSIDVPLTMWTMLLSGLIMLKVASPQGHALVCLDARRGTKYACIMHEHSVSSNNKKDDLRLVCLELSRLSLGKSSPLQRPASEKRKIPLKMTELEWNRVLGLYNDRDAEFV